MYERRKFSVHQATWPVKPQKIVDITATSLHVLSHGTIAGAVVGSVAGLTLLGILCLVMMKKRRRVLSTRSNANIDDLDEDDSSSSEGLQKTIVHPHEIDGRDCLGPEIDGVNLPGHEIGGSHYHGHELTDSIYRQELDGSQEVKHEMPV